MPRSGEPDFPEHPYQPSCVGSDAALPVPSVKAFPDSAVIVDDLPRGSSTLTDCGNVQTSRRGSFEFILSSDADGDVLGQVDLHQLGAGYEGHMWYAHTNWKDRSSHTVTGRWTPPRGVKNGWYRIMVHVPPIGADTYQADYRIFDGTEGAGEESKFHRVVNQRWREPRWVDLGIFRLEPGNKVELSNETFSDYGNGKNVDIAWDAIAYIPEGGPPDVAMVSLGDSYSSGEGGETYFGNSDRGENSSNVRNACHRSVAAYGQLTYNVLSIGASNGRSTYAFKACSGATTRHLYEVDGEPAEDHFGEVPQLLSGWIDENTTHVTLGIGGNDAQFGDVLEACILNLQPDCTTKVLDGDILPIRDAVPLHNENVRPALITIIDEIQRQSGNDGNVKIALVGYPEVIANPPSALSVCDNLLSTQFVEPRPDDPPGSESMTVIDWFDLMVGRMNGVIEDVADQYPNVTYVDFQGIYDGHEACSPKKLTGGQWINAVTYQSCESCKAPASAASFHPNDIGHGAAWPEVFRALEYGVNATPVNVGGSGFR